MAPGSGRFLSKILLLYSMLVDILSRTFVSRFSVPRSSAKFSHLLQPLRHHHTAAFVFVNLSDWYWYFVKFTTKWYMCAAEIQVGLFPYSRVFSVLLSILITSLGEPIAGLYASRVFVCLCMHYRLFLFRFSRYQGLPVVCDCGTPWTYYFTFHI